MEISVEEYLAEQNSLRGEIGQTVDTVSKEMENDEEKSVEEYLKEFENDDNGTQQADTIAENREDDLSVEEYLAKMSRDTDEGEMGLNEENEKDISVEEYLKQMEHENKRKGNGEVQGSHANVYVFS